MTVEISDLVGVKEAAERLGILRSNFVRLAKRVGFPAPVMQLAATPVWRWSDIARYTKKTHA
jgi:predicted DNA-binding transcriptional regulator AlpA